jgi:hypothetical protein
MDSIFTEIYTNNSWISSESRSGSGSTHYQTRHIQESIKELIKKYKINSLFDIPCGDFNWFKNIVDHIPNYIGGDIVKHMIKENTIAYTKYKFIEFDIISDPIPESDLIFCRDLFVHFSLKNILSALENIRKSSAKYILMTTFTNRNFNDIDTGKWRPISFFDIPFSFPYPLEIINENCKEFYPKYIDKSLGLWLVKDIPRYVPLKIFQTWHDKALPPTLQNNVEYIKTTNPEFEVRVFSLEECEQFIKDNYEERVLNAYNTLIPLAYKADLWRLCVLYIYGGIYLDISFKPINNFKFIEIIDREYFSSEVRLKPYENDQYKGTSNGLISVYPKNEVIYKSIYAIVDNIEKRYYGEGVYDITGAIVLGSFFTEKEKREFLLKRVVNECNGYSFKGRNILDRIKEYDKKIVTPVEKYNKLWRERQVFT